MTLTCVGMKRRKASHHAPSKRYGPDIESNCATVRRFHGTCAHISASLVALPCNDVPYKLKTPAS